MFRLRKKLALDILRLKLPPLALYLILSVPLIIFEEQIDCMPAWCGAVAIPPTLPFILVEMLVLGGIVLWRHAQNVLRVTFMFSIFGVIWEIFLGGLVGDRSNRGGVPGEAFISMLPLEVLIKGQTTPSVGKTVLAVPSFHLCRSLSLELDELQF